MHNSPGKLIDFAKVRSLIRINDVLMLLAWEPCSLQGPQLRGACPLPNCATTSRRTFCVNHEQQAWHCFACGRHGNQLDLWVIMSGQPLYQATVELCHRAGKSVPYRASQQTRLTRNSRRNPPAGPQ